VSAADPLGSCVRGLFSDLAHGGEGSTRAAVPLLQGEAGRESEGTRVHFTLRVEAGRLCEMRYRAYGCPYTLASCEWLARQLEGQSQSALAGPNPSGIGGLGGPLDWARRLGVPQERLGRLLIIEDALRNALAGLTNP
jgi:hypothetical protein